MNLLEKAQQFFDSLPAHQKPACTDLEILKIYLEEYGYVHLWFAPKGRLSHAMADLHPEGWEWFWHGEMRETDGTDFGYEEELPKEFYDRLNELFPETK